MTSSSSILHTCKISRKLKNNSYIINKFFKLQVFVRSLKLCVENKLIDHIVNNIQLTQNLTRVLIT